jgi:hypothetical protein
MNNKNFATSGGAPPDLLSKEKDSNNIPQTQQELYLRRYPNN